MFGRVPAAALTVEAELMGEPLFIFRASSSGVEAAGAGTTLAAGPGSRLMTGMAGEQLVGNGAVRRLLRVVVEVELEVVEEDEESWGGAGSGGGFSGSGAEILNHTQVKGHNRASSTAPQRGVAF